MDSSFKLDEFNQKSIKTVFCVFFMYTGPNLGDVIFGRRSGHGNVSMPQLDAISI